MTTDPEIYDSLLIDKDVSGYAELRIQNEDGTFTPITYTHVYGVIGVGLVKLTLNGRNYLLWGFPKAWKWLDENRQVLPKRPAPTPQEFRHSWMRSNKLYIYPRKFGWWLNNTGEL